ncbi:Homeobox-leucine zipper protein HDG11 [Botrytis cinerea]
MANFEALPPQPDWREQYSSYQLSGENGMVHQNYEHSASSSTNNTQQQPVTRPTLEHRHTLGPMRPEGPPTPTVERPDSAPGDSPLSLGPIASNPVSSASSAPQQGVGALMNEDTSALLSPKEEDDDDIDDDDDMLDTEDGSSSTPQTAAERRAERRKMKRFRLTHQQTRFLMSEFAKQAHPDAAHRERLSREIPGLSPRQVQVWFQNRRAKIKRLTADDRERMMKMRAVPDDFDNVQALHSPYGAVHGIGTPMQSPVDFVPNYADHMIRPLMVDTMRRHEQDDQMSPAGMSPGYGHVGYTPGSSIGTPDVLSPLSINSSDRYFSSHLSSPMSSGPRSSNPFDRPPPGYQAVSHSQQRHHGARPLQPLQLRETMSRSRSESLQSPLRSSMSWKGETLDYANYPTGQPSPQSTGRQQSLYQPEQNNTVNAHQFESNSYPSSNIQNSPQHMSYSPSHPPASLQQSSPAAMSRLRASTGGPSHLPPTSRPFVPPYSAGFASAPLTAPMEYSLPRTPSDANHPQLSAPMAPPQDFANAYNASRAPQSEREFSSQGQEQQHAQGHAQSEHQPQRNNSESSSYLRPNEFQAKDNRKRSFTMPGTYAPSHMS